MLLLNITFTHRNLEARNNPYEILAVDDTLELSFPELLHEQINSEIKSTAFHLPSVMFRKFVTTIKKK